MQPKNHLLVELFGPPVRTTEVRRGDCLFRRSEPARAIFVVLSGRLRLERSTRDGSIVGLAVLGPGSGVAEAALFADAYHCDARAEVKTRVGVYPKAEALEALERQPDAYGRLARGFAGEVRRLRALLEVRSIRRMEDRVLAYLDLLDVLGERWGAARPTSAMAAELGSTPEALYRALARLEEEGRIERQGRRVKKR